MEKGSWLRIEGVLTEGGWRYRPKPGNEAGRIPAEFSARLDAQQTSAIEAVLLDAAGQLLARGQPLLSKSVCRTDTADAPLRMAAYVPLLPGAVAYEIRNGGVTLYHAAISAEIPAVRITRCTLDGDYVTVAWRAQASEAFALYYRVACILGNRTFPLATLTDQNTLRTSLANVPGPGDARISVMVSDGVRSAVALSDPFPLPARPPVLTILSPVDQGSYGFHEPIALTAAAMDPGGRTLPDQGIEWLCDNRLVAQDTRSAVLTDAPEGPHRITLSLGGAETSVSVTVREQTPGEREWAGIFGVERPSRTES